MSQDKTAQTNNDERVKELEALLEAKEQELAGSRRLQDLLVEKMLDIRVELRNMQAKESAKTVKNEGDAVKPQLDPVKKEPSLPEDGLEKPELSNTGFLKSLQKDRKDEAPKSTPSLSPPVPLAPPVSLKFSFLATPTSVSTSARMTSETDIYELYSLSSSWCDICPEQEITRLGLRHNSTAFLTPGGGKALQMFDPPFTGPVPTVVIWLTGIRLNRSRPWRVRCRADDVTPAGFTAVVESWGDSELEAAGVAWVAYDKEQSGIWSGGVQVQESGWVCEILQGQGEQQCDTLFKRWPIAMTAVNELIALHVGVGLYFLVQISGRNGSMIKWTVNPAGDGSVVRVGCVGIMLGQVQASHSESYWTRESP